MTSLLRLAACIAGMAALARAAELPPNQWVRVDADHTGARTGHQLLYVPAMGKAVAFGGALVGEAPYVQAFDPAARTWSAVADRRPEFRRLPGTFGDAVALDPDRGRVWFLHHDRLHSFHLEGGTWHDHGSHPLLATVMAEALAYDPVHRELLLVGASTRPEERGWSAVLACEPEANAWRRLALGDAQAREAHARRLAIIRAVRELAGRTRAAWYPDPEGTGTEAQRADLVARCGELSQVPGVQAAAKLIRQARLLEAIEALRRVRRELEAEAEAKGPVPPARCRSPLVCDPADKLLLRFGGDHQDYLANDTWLLDLESRTWRRAQPPAAPAPRAGHGLAYLPGCGKIALWDGYRQTNDPDYRSRQAGPLPHRELWLYDAGDDRWDLAAAWPTSEDDDSLPRHVDLIGDYGRFAPTALAADPQGRLVLLVPGRKVHSKRRYGQNLYTATWMLRVEPPAEPSEAAGKLATPPDQRARRTGIFTAAFCEQAADADPPDLEALQPNRWTRLPPVPRNPCVGQRQRTWGTAAWDPHREQILFWTGGHCAGCSSPVLHYSPASHRMAEGYDAEEQYGHQGAHGATLLGRPWVPTHAYHIYDYDPRCRLLVAAKEVTYLYDPARMDWLPRTVDQPFNGHCFVAQLHATPHGVVAWAPRGDRAGPRGLWLFDLDAGWRDIEPQGAVPTTTVDNSGACYDSQRDRLLLVTSPSYSKPTDGTVWSFDFASRKVQRLSPAQPQVGHFRGFRELVYVAHADWMLALKPLEREGALLTRFYDCAADRWRAVDLGPGIRHMPSASSGSAVYDAGRRLVLVILPDGALFALRLDPARL
ncbi:MAG: kelch repeat-containing protein [Candidatus Brocadiia bacterium]